MRTTRRAGRDGPVTPATTALDRAGIGYGVHPYAHDPGGELSYGLEAATALGVAPQLVLKTLVARVDGLRGQGLAVAILPVVDTMDLKAFAQVLGHKKAAMADPAAAERATGYVTGGISPIGQRAALPTVIHAAVQSLELVYVSGGRRGFDISLAPHDLAQVTHGQFAPIARG